MKNIVLIAPPGAGKGTLSEKLVEKYNYIHISTGDLIRNHKEYQKTIESGNLISDEQIIYILKNKLKEINKSKPFILDGFPRTYEQVVHMINLFKELNINDYIVINFDVEKEILIDRILNRVICNNCKHIYNLKYLKDDNICPNCGSVIEKRSDDKISTFNKRYAIYENNINSIIECLKNEQKLFKLDDSVSKNIKDLDIKKILGDVIDNN